MKNEFIPYEQALALKELGFDEPCFGYYTGDKKHLIIRPSMGRRNEDLNDIVCTAPLYQQAFRWFREKHNLYGEVIIQQRPSLEFIYGFKISPTNIIQGGFSTYEESELACLSKLIKLIKKN